MRFVMSDLLRDALESSQAFFGGEKKLAPDLHRSASTRSLVNTGSHTASDPNRAEGHAVVHTFV